MSTQQQQQGLGVITFFEDGKCSAVVRPVSQVAWHQGKYILGHGVDIENETIRLSLRPVDNPTPRGPRMRGRLLIKDTGEEARVVAWRASLEDETPCLGLSLDRPLPQRAAAPF